MTAVAARLDNRRPIWVAALYKTVFYCAVSVPILLAERVGHFYQEAGALDKAVVEAWKHADRNRVLAKVIIVALVFGCYHLYKGIDQRLGQGKLWRMMISEPQAKPATGKADGSSPKVESVKDYR